MDSRQVKIMKVVLLISSVASMVVLALAAFEENFRGDWRVEQRKYHSLLVSTAGTDAARAAAEGFVIEHKQLYLPDRGTIDRCTTCHLGVENPAMADAEPPLRRHSGDWLTQHPTDRFGCTVCHEGEGLATTERAAHGRNDDDSPVEKMDHPLLLGEAVYTSCGRCHYEVDLYGGESDLFAKPEATNSEDVTKSVIDESSLRLSLSGADALAEGKRLVVQSGCLGCHQYRGRGGTLGPELSFVGDKTKHDFDFSRVRGEHTVEQWLYEHFMLPSEVSPGTQMPDLGLTEGQARSLALYMMSLHRKSAPASLTPSPRLASAEPASGETLYKMFCSACHGVDGLGTTMRSGLWPTDADPWGHGWDARTVVVEQRGDVEVIVPSLNHPDALGVASNDYLRRIVSHGRPGTKMPAWATEGGLADDEITLLVGYLRAWNPPAPDLDSVSAGRGDARVGRTLYRANCATCHGADGAGGIGNSLNSPTFLAVASDAFLRDTIVFGRANTAMPAWRQFDAQEVSDLIAYLRGWQPARSDAATVARLVAEGSPEVSVSVGRTLYKANCVMCHGADGSGDLAPSLQTQAFLTAVPDSYLITTLLEGRSGTGMPAWRHLSNDDVASIVRFLRTWQTKSAQTAQWRAQVVPRGDEESGARLFSGHCAACHGTDAEGATGPQLNNPTFLAVATDVMLREWITFGKEGTAMRAFRKGGQGISELSGRQIEDLVAYLRSLERKGPGEIIRVSKSPNGRPERGAAIYASNCSGCHGVRGEGASGPALSNPDFLRHASDGFLMATMAIGRRGTEMRPVKRGPQSILVLTSDEVNDVVAYLRSWEYDSPFGSRGEGEIPHRFVVPWGFARGRELFQSNCAGCHGVEGRGLWAPELNNEGFLAAATDGFLQATIIRGRRGTAMRPFGRGAHGLVDLSGDDVDDIVAYIRHWSTVAPSPMTLPALRSLEPLGVPGDERGTDVTWGGLPPGAPPLRATSHEVRTKTHAISNSVAAARPRAPGD